MANENSKSKLAVMGNRKIKSTILIIYLGFSIILGCAVIQGKLIKTYESEYHDTVQASRDTLKDLKIPVTEKMSDELKTVIKAKRFDGTPISIEVIRIDENLTEVSIITGSVGVLDKRVSGQIHNYIKKELVKYPHKEKNLIENKPEKKYQTPSEKSSDQRLSKIIPETQKPTDKAPTKPTKDSSIQNKTEHQLYDAESQFKAKMLKYSHKEKNLIENKPEKNYQTSSEKSSDQHVSKIIPETQRPTNKAPTKSTKDSSIQNKTEHRLYDAESEADSEFKIFFQKDSNELSGKAIEKLDRIFEIMTNNPDYELTIIGFPDSERPSPYNKMISDLRVAGVKMYLIGKGLNLSKTKTLFFETEGNPPNHSVELKINAQTEE